MKARTVDIGHDCVCVGTNGERRGRQKNLSIKQFASGSAHVLGNRLLRKKPIELPRVFVSYTRHATKLGNRGSDLYCFVRLRLHFDRGWLLLQQQRFARSVRMVG